MGRNHNIESNSIVMDSKLMFRIVIYVIFFRNEDTHYMSICDAASFYTYKRENKRQGNASKEKSCRLMQALPFRYPPNSCVGCPPGEVDHPSLIHVPSQYIYPFTLWQERRGPPG